MLKKDFKSFYRFYNVWTSKQTYKRRFLAIPWKNGSTHWHFYCEAFSFDCHFDTFRHDEAKLLKLEMF